MSQIVSEDMEVEFHWGMDLFRYMDEMADKRALAYPLMSSVWPVFGIIVSYYLFVTKIGRSLMANRKPFELKNFMVAYNLFQVFSNGAICLLIYRSMRRLNYPLYCIEIRYGTDEDSQWCLFLAYSFFFLKLIDLLDTIIMILRKNYHQISVLHVYHHIGMVAGTYIFTRYFPGGQATILAVINSFVHVIMYAYYMMAAYNPVIKKSIRLKKNITRLQLLQFNVINIGFLVAILNPSCNQPKIPLMILVTQVMLMIYMFSVFYYKMYINPKKKTESNKN